MDHISGSGTYIHGRGFRSVATADLYRTSQPGLTCTLTCSQSAARSRPFNSVATALSTGLPTAEPNETGSLHLIYPLPVSYMQHTCSRQSLPPRSCVPAAYVSTADAQCANSLHGAEASHERVTSISSNRNSIPEFLLIEFSFVRNGARVRE